MASLALQPGPVVSSTDAVVAPQLQPLISEAPNKLYCQLSSCPAHDPAHHPGWQTNIGLRSHMDQHMLGLLDGRPSNEWLDAEN